MSEAQEAAKVMSNFCNGYYSRQIEEFVEEMSYEHRTLQQSFTKVCFAWIEHLAQSENYDLRNEAAVEACKSIMANDPNLNLPLI